MIIVSVPNSFFSCFPLLPNCYLLLSVRFPLFSAATLCYHFVICCYLCVSLCFRLLPSVTGRIELCENYPPQYLPLASICSNQVFSSMPNCPTRLSCITTKVFSHILWACLIGLVEQECLFWLE